MRFQSTLLVFIVLISFFLIKNFYSSPNSSQLAAETRAEKTELPNPPVEKEGYSSSDASLSLFAKDLYFALLEKAVLTNKNLAVAKELLFYNTDKIFAYLPSLIPSSENKIDNSTSLTTNSEPVKKVKKSLSCEIGNMSFESEVMMIRYLDNNSKIFDLNSEKRWPIASLTKLMSSIIILENIDLNKEIAITLHAVSSDGEAGGFKEGEIFRARDLVKAMLMVSSNDAATAIADDFGADIFIAKMREKANELKMSQTEYVEPTGLSFVNQSTAEDMAKLIDYIYSNHLEILEISRQKEALITDLNFGGTRKLLSTNKFAGQNDYIGGKTGYIEEAGRNLITVFNIGGEKVLIIMFGANDAFKEVEKARSALWKCAQEDIVKGFL